MRRSPKEILAGKVARTVKGVLPPRLWSGIKEQAARHVFGRNLRMLATIYGSDKWGSHWYAGHYERHFAARRADPIVLLEIGIGGFDNPRGGGASLRMWQHYFPRGRINGVDIYDKSPHETAQIRTFVGDQTDEHFLRQLVAKIGTPDIVIDDGSHLNAHVIKTFEILFPLLAEDGIYVVEDLCTSYWPDFGGSSDDLVSPSTSMGMLKGLIDGLNHQEYMREDYAPSYCDQHIVAMHFYHNLMFCQKGKNGEPGSRGRQ